MIFGGPYDRPIDTFSLEELCMDENDEIDDVIKGFQQELKKLSDPFMQGYLLLY